jgi:hypothetical protein
MKIIGIILIIWGIADFALSWMETDLYFEIGIMLPDIIYPFTAWIAMGIGFAIFSMDKSKEK